MQMIYTIEKNIGRHTGEGEQKKRVGKYKKHNNKMEKEKEELEGKWLDGGKKTRKKGMKRKKVRKRMKIQKITY